MGNSAECSRQCESRGGRGNAATAGTGIDRGSGAAAGDVAEAAATTARAQGSRPDAVGIMAGIPEGVRASVAASAAVYDARRLRSQREMIRDVMLAASDCETWLTLGELRALTRYGEASISAQLRHLRKQEHGGYEVVKRQREGVSPERPGAIPRGECVWEYRIARTCATAADTHREEAAVGT